LYSAEDETQQYHNVAQFKTATQSSLYGANNPASLAVDDSSSTCARTSEEKGASWMVDLGQKHTISHLRINTGHFTDAVVVLSATLFTISLSVLFSYAL